MLLYSIFENSLPVLPAPWQQQQQPAVPQQQQQQQVDGAKLAATFPYITQAAADRSLGVIAQVGMRAVNPAIFVCRDVWHSIHVNEHCGDVVLSCLQHCVATCHVRH